MKMKLLTAIRPTVTSIILAGSLISPSASFAMDGADSMKDTVSKHLGGLYGIYNFLEKFAVPALLADPIVGPYFNGKKFTPTESGFQISACLALFLDNELGGPSPHSGDRVIDAGSPDILHKCRGSMTQVHKAMKLDDTDFTQFITIVAQQAKRAGIPDADIAEVGAALERTRKLMVMAK
jgi:hypothetical protein